MARRDHPDVGITLRAIEYWVQGFIDSGNPFVDWDWQRSNYGRSINAVAGCADLLAFTEEGEERRLCVTQWLGRTSTDLVVGYGMRDLEAGPLMAWNAGSTQLKEVQFMKAHILSTARSNFAAMASLAALLPKAIPINSKPFDPF
jgi:hypothetical protein